MALLQDLPPELLILILSLVGSNSRTYSQKERQGDLAVFALVHSSFLAPAQHLLYTGNILIRNAGRSALLARTLLANPELADLVQTLSVDSQQSDHPPSLVQILSCTNPSSLALDAAVFQAGKASTALYELLLLRREAMRSFTWRGEDSYFKDEVEQLLKAWSGLEHLSLEFTRSNWPYNLGTRPRPTYRLKSLRLPNDPWILEDLEWVLGSTTTELRHLTTGRPAVDTAPLIRSGGSMLCATRDPHRFTDLLQHLTTLHLFPAYIPSTGLAHILARTPQLQHLSFAAEYFSVGGDGTSSRPEPIPLPPLLQTLELHRPENIDVIRLTEALEAKARPQALHSVLLHRLFPTDELARKVWTVCHVEGIQLDVRPF